MAAARPPATRSLKNLADLKQVQRQLAETREREAAEAAERAAAERKRAAEKDLFARAVGATEPLRQKTRTVPLAPEPPAPIPVQHQLDEQRVLRESLSDEFDVTTLLDVDDAMSFRRPGIGTDVTARLRKGDWTIQAQVDLHGLRSDEAREALASFLRRSVRNGVRCVRVIHGKGMGSPDKLPVLKGKVRSWLVQKEEVIAFVQARESLGGAGALMVLLRQPRS